MGMQYIIFWCEFDFACLYALRKPELARDCAAKAWSAALRMKRPDLAARANELMSLL